MQNFLSGIYSKHGIGTLFVVVVCVWGPHPEELRSYTQLHTQGSLLAGLTSKYRVPGTDHRAIRK